MRKIIDKIKSCFNPKQKRMRKRDKKNIMAECQHIWRLFNRYRNLIISVAIVGSIIRTMLWYSLWSVNILSFSNLQDIFTYTIETLIVFGLLLSIFVVVKPLNIILRIILIVLAGFFTFLLFDSHFSIIVTIVITYFLYLSIFTPKRLAFDIWTIIIMMIILQPTERYFTDINTMSRIQKQNSHNKPRGIFTGKNAPYKQISFVYNDMHINTEEQSEYYLIGSNTQYFFVYNVKQEVTMIIPITECRDIQSKRLTIQKMLNF